VSILRWTASKSVEMEYQISTLLKYELLIPPPKNILFADEVAASQARG
jgi:hypothetical protein